MPITVEDVFGPLDTRYLIIFLSRLLFTAILTFVIGYEREKSGKQTGLRTHMLIGLAVAAFIASSDGSSISDEGISRVLQGITTGVFTFALLALYQRDAPNGPMGATTAASVVVTSAIGYMVGLGQIIPALMITVIAWIVLHLFVKAENK